MAQPIISWYNATNTDQISAWAIGTVDAGSVSPDTSFLIWNNRGGSSAVSDMTACTITTKDIGGGNTGEIVTNKWIEVKVDSMSESTFTAIGGVDTKAIKAGGAGVPAGQINGAINDGTLTATSNFSKVTLHANIPASATAGNVPFLTRVAYQYV